MFCGIYYMGSYKKDKSSYLLRQLLYIQ